MTRTGIWSAGRKARALPWTRQGALPPAPPPGVRRPLDRHSFRVILGGGHPRRCDQSGMPPSQNDPQWTAGPGDTVPRRSPEAEPLVGFGATPRSFLSALHVLALIIGLILPGVAWAVSDPGEMLRDSGAEVRAQEIGRQLRCLVCQNQSVEDSDAQLARDLRKIVRQRVVAGDSDQAVVEWVVARYGDFVRLRPPFRAGTYLLWFSPVLALVMGGGAVWLARRRVLVVAPVPLRADEQRRLAKLGVELGER